MTQGSLTLSDQAQAGGLAAKPGPAGPASRARAARALLGALAFALALACLAAPAQAARIRTPLVTETLPEERTPLGVAVNQSTHHFYVASFGVGGGHWRVTNFEENGQIDIADPELTLPVGFEPFLVAVDNSGGVHSGDIYASDTAGAIQQFDPSGEATAVTITASALPSNGTPQGGGLPPVVNTGGFGPRAIAVGPTGNIYAQDQETNAIEEFSPSGAFVAQLAAGSVHSCTGGIAISAAGNIYLANDCGPVGSGLTGNGLIEIDSSGNCVAAGCAPIDPAPISGVAIDETRGTIFTTRSNEAIEPTDGKFAEYDATTGALEGVIKPPGLHSPYGIGVDEASGDVIIADEKPNQEGTIKIYGPVEVVPDVQTEAAGAITDDSATLHGKIGAAEVPGATCAFQYASQEDFEANRFEAAAEAPCEPAGPFSGSAMNEVHADLNALQGGTTYHYRLVGTNENGSNSGEGATFQTLGPSITEEQATEVTETGARLSGLIDPNGTPTTYRFQYVSQAGFEASGFTGATDLPATPASVPFAATGIGSLEAGSKTVLGVIAAEGTFITGQHLYGPGIAAGTKIESIEEDTLELSQAATETHPGAEIIASSPQPVAVEVSGLSPASDYRFRILAESAEGTTSGPAEAFSTFRPTPTGLPDGRAYEQVSPTEKNGASIQGEVNGVQASADGDRVTFGAYAGIPGGEGQQTLASYMASRAKDASGWSTQGMLPPASAGPTANTLGWDEDLAEIYDYASEPFGSTRLLDRSSADGSLSEVARIEKPTTATLFFFAGASAGGAVALLESSGGGLLPGDRPGKQNAYAYDRETGTLVVAGVMNDGSVPPGGAMGGPYDWFGAENTSSQGGGAVQYFTEAGHAISSDGKRIFFTAGATGQLYIRENPLAPQSAMSGEECSEAAKACTVRVSAPEEGTTDPGSPAAFVGASADGSLVYFLDKGKLTADATGGAGYDLYRYDVESGQLTDVTLDSADKSGAQVEGMLGLSAEGNDAYFVAAGGLTAGASRAPNGETNLYALHGDAIEFIARLSANEEAERQNWFPRSKTGGNVIVAHTSRVSADGQALLFTSSRRITSYRSHGQDELYLYRTGKGIQCISCNPSGEPPAGPAGVQEIPKPGVSPARFLAIMTRNLSADGRRVIFDTPDRLVSSDENGVNDVYEWEEEGKGSCQSEAENGGCLFLLSPGTGSEPSYLGDADPEGNNVFIFTEARLVSQDKDQLVDVYDARVGGGIPGQDEQPKPPCEGEACLGQGSGGGASQTAGSASFSGPGNPARPPACAKGRARRQGRCVKPKHAKKKHSKKHHKQRRAGRTRGGSGR